MSKAQAVDPLKYTLTESEIKDEKVLESEGNKGTCMIEIVKFHPIDPDKDKYGKLKKGITGQLQITLSNAKMDHDMTAYLNFKPGGLTSKYPLRRLMDAAGVKTVEELNGESVDVYVAHEDTNGSKWIDWKFTPPA